MLDDDRLGPDLDFFDHQPEHPLALGDSERLRRVVKLGQKAFEAFGKRDVRLSVEPLCLERRELTLHHRLPLAEGRHAGAKFIKRDELLLIGLN